MKKSRVIVVAGVVLAVVLVLAVAGWWRSTEEFKILRYVGQDGCSSCKLHLHIYPQVLAGLKERAGCPVGFVCIVNPADMNEIRRLLRRDNSAGLTIWVDRADSLNSINSFPEIGDLQTFLLDGENRVL